MLKVLFSWFLSTSSSVFDVLKVNLGCVKLVDVFSLVGESMGIKSSPVSICKQRFLNIFLYTKTPLFLHIYIHKLWVNEMALDYSKTSSFPTIHSINNNNEVYINRSLLCR